jgi:hypothetical protein
MNTLLEKNEVIQFDLTAILVKRAHNAFKNFACERGQADLPELTHRQQINILLWYRYNCSAAPLFWSGPLLEVVVE